MGRKLGRPKWVLGGGLVLAVGMLALLAFLQFRLPVSMQHGVLIHAPAHFSILLPDLQNWELTVQNYRGESGYVVVWRHKVRPATLYLNIVQTTAENGLDLATIQARSFEKMRLKGFVATARAENPEQFFYVRGDREVAGMYFRELASHYILSTIISGDTGHFDDYRTDWQKMLASIK